MQLFVNFFIPTFKGVWGRHKNKKRLRYESQPFDAERTRFELAVGLLLRQFSKLLVSATHPPLQCFVLICF